MDKEKNECGSELWSKIRVDWRKNNQIKEDKDSEQSFSSINSITNSPEDMKTIKNTIKSKGPFKPFSQKQKLSNIVDICEEIWEDEVYY